MSKKAAKAQQQVVVQKSFSNDPNSNEEKCKQALLAVPDMFKKLRVHELSIQ